MKKTSFPFLKALVVYAEDALDKVTNIDLVCQFCFRLLIWYIRSFYLLQQHDHFRTILLWSLTIFVFFDKFSLYHFFYLISKCVLVVTTREFFLFLNHVICMALLTASKQYWNGLAFWRTCFHLPFIMVDNPLWPYLYLCLFPLPTFFSSSLLFSQSLFLLLSLQLPVSTTVLLLFLASCCIPFILYRPQRWRLTFRFESNLLLLDLDWNSHSYFHSSTGFTSFLFSFLLSW